MNLLGVSHSSRKCRMKVFIVEFKFAIIQITTIIIPLHFILSSNQYSHVVCYVLLTQNQVRHNPSSQEFYHRVELRSKLTILEQHMS